LNKIYHTFIAECTQKAVAEFTPHQKAVGLLMPKIVAANKGEKVVFTAEEQATLKNAAAAAKKFENISGLFTPKNLAALTTQINNAKGIQATANKYAKSDGDKITTQTSSISEELTHSRPTLLRDEKGNLIVVKDGPPIQIKNKLIRPYVYKGQEYPVEITCTTQFAHIFTNQNKPIKGWIINSVDAAILLISDKQVLPLPPTKFEEFKKEIHVESNCHGESLANGQVFIPDMVLKNLFTDPKEFKADPSLKNIVVFFDDSNPPQPKHSTKYDPKTQTYRYDNGEKKPNNGTLKEAQGRYKNPKGVEEVEKRVKQDKGVVKNGIRIINKDSDVKK